MRRLSSYLVFVIATMLCLPAVADFKCLPEAKDYASKQSDNTYTTLATCIKKAELPIFGAPVAYQFGVPIVWGDTSESNAFAQTMQKAAKKQGDTISIISDGKAGFVVNAYDANRKSVDPIGSFKFPN